MSIAARAGEEEKLFGSVTNLDIQKALAAQGFDVDRKKIHLDGPIKTLGEHVATVDLGAGVRAPVKVTVVAVEAPPAAE
jgi:large subunit ribosomal protein L9